MKSNEKRSQNHFRIYVNNDGVLTEEEFLKGCLDDEELSMMLSQSNVMTQTTVLPSSNVQQ